MGSLLALGRGLADGLLGLTYSYLSLSFWRHEGHIREALVSDDIELFITSFKHDSS